MGDLSNVLSAFGEEHAERLTGVSKRQLRYWDQTGLFSPSYAEPGDRSSFGRVYSFKDIVSLRVLNALRNQFGVPLQQLRKVSDELQLRAVERWTGTKLWVVNKQVAWQEPGGERPQEIVSRQFVLPVDLTEVISATQRDVGILRSREAGDLGKIRKTRAVSHNASVIAGTRIRVQAVEQYISAGYSNRSIIGEYPDLTTADIETVRLLSKRQAA